MPLKASYHTLGCKLNFSETATIEGILRQKGIERVKEKETPDLCIVNTCSVTETADKKARHLIRQLYNKFPEASIIVTGCYAQLKPEEVAALPGVKLVLGSNEKLRISGYIDSWLQNAGQIVKTIPHLSLKEFMPSCERGERTRFFLKVQDGCDYYCSYCTIPQARGRSRSGKISLLTDMAKEAADKGGKEIVLTGVNVGTFGKDTGEKFLDLLKALDEIKEIERYRISSIEPNLLTDEIIEWIAKESRAFMPHFHIPLQSGSDNVLKLMRRKYDTALFRSKIETIRSRMPDAYIGVDIIAGANGETPEEWIKSFEFAKSIDISKYHVFPYSERPGTKALQLGDVVPMADRKHRVATLMILSDIFNKNFITQNKGKVRKVLWERPVGKSLMHGLTDNYIRIEAPYIPELINTVTEVIVGDLKPGTTDTAFGDHKV